MKLKSLEIFEVTLPFRWSFGHSLATRNCSQNIIVKTQLEDGTTGYGESVPRNYVTGESPLSVKKNIENYAKIAQTWNFNEPLTIRNHLEETFISLGLSKNAAGASWCAFELAILDACSKLHRKYLGEWLATLQQNKINYGAVIPFAGKKKLLAMLFFLKFFRFSTVKIKVGVDLHDDLAKIKLTRRIMGPSCKLRIDANCAWSVDYALKAADAFRPFGILSYEQPVAANDWEGLKKITQSIPEDVIVDESLCTIDQAKTLAENKICNAFNIRLSKVGGILASQRILQIALQNNLRCHLGAQVGESGILSAAGRFFALSNPLLENYEGSANSFLLRKDITYENLTVHRGGVGDLTFINKEKHGLGITINEARLKS